MAGVHDFNARLPGGGARALADFAGEVLLIVNVASRCGFTPQYEALEILQKELDPRGFSVLAFPCDQFGGQEPGSDEEIAQFCAVNYRTSFPLFAKIEVNGAGADPLWSYLKRARPGLLGSTAVKWNFTKFLVDADGRVVERFAPTTPPETIRPEIERLLDLCTPAKAGAQESRPPSA